MKGIFIFPVLPILFCIPAFADYQKGLAAFESGDYATALKEWEPLADQRLEPDLISDSHLL